MHKRSDYINKCLLCVECVHTICDRETYQFKQQHAQTEPQNVHKSAKKYANIQLIVHTLTGTDFKDRFFTRTHTRHLGEL